MSIFQEIANKKPLQWARNKLTWDLTNLIAARVNLERTSLRCFLWRCLGREYYIFDLCDDCVSPGIPPTQNRFNIVPNTLEEYCALPFGGLKEWPTWQQPRWLLQQAFGSVIESSTRALCSAFPHLCSSSQTKQEQILSSLMNHLFVVPALSLFFLPPL